MSDGMSDGISNGMGSETWKSDTSQTCKIFVAHFRDTKLMSVPESSKIAQTARDKSRVTQTSEMVGNI